MLSKLLKFKNSSSLSSFLLFAVLVYLIIVFVIPHPTEDKTTTLQLGDIAPEIILRDLKGNKFNSATFSDSYLLVNFWATWCPPCVAEIDILKKMYTEFSKLNVLVIGINQDSHNIGLVRRFCKEKDINYPVLFDDGIIGNQYGIVSLPTTVLLDTEGKVQAVFHGMLNYNKVLNKIKEKTKNNNISY